MAGSSELEAGEPDRELKRIQKAIDAMAKAEAAVAKKQRQEQDREKSRQRKSQKLEAGMLDFHEREAVWMDQLPAAPTFYPTQEQFKDPLAYIRSIQREASQYGICKIVPPVAPVMPGGLVLAAVEGRGFRFTCRQQVLAEPDWSSFETINPFSDGTKRFSVGDYEKQADEFARKRFGCAGNLPPRMVENEYWRARTKKDDTFVEYGNDVEGSAFTAADSRDPLGSSRWNLRELPRDAASVLQVLDTNIPGVNSPMLYVGMLFATFAWHVEDHYLYSINYQHLGASKTWYGVPAASADAFEKAALEQVYNRAIEQATRTGYTGREARDSALRHLLRKTTMFSPRILVESGVKVCRAIQAPGDIIVTFPRAYHSGFSNGFCIGEAANFGMAEWFSYAEEARKRYRALERPPILPFEALLQHHIRQLAAEKRGPEGQPNPAGTLQRTFLRHMRRLHVARAAVQQRGAACQLLPKGCAGVLCIKCRDACRLAVVVLPSKAPPPPEPPLQNGDADSSGGLSEGEAAAKPPPPAALPAIMCLECGAAAEAGSGSTVFVVPDLLELEALAQQLEADTDVALHESEADVEMGGLSEATLAPLLKDFAWQQLPPPDENALEASPGGGQQNKALQALESRLEAARQQQERQHAAAAAEAAMAQSPPPSAKSPGPKYSERAGANSGRRSGSRQLAFTADKTASAERTANGHASDSAFAETAASDMTPPAAGAAEAPVEAAKPVPCSQCGRFIAADAAQPDGAKAHSGGDSGAAADDRQQQRFCSATCDAAWHASDRGGARHSTRKRKPTAASKQMQAMAEEAAESRPGKRRPSTIAATAAADAARAAAAANAAAAAARWDRQPPTFERSAWDERALLNGPTEALVCVEDATVSLAPAAPDVSLRRRIFSPPRSADERYLLAREVVKASGVDYNTSAPNVVQRWFRAIMRRAKQYGLPLPSLPRRALLADVSHSRGCGAAAGVDVLSAEEVMMVAWVVDTPARARLAAFTLGAWPNLPNLLQSHHLQGLLRLDAGNEGSARPQDNDSPTNSTPPGSAGLQHRGRSGSGALPARLQQLPSGNLGDMGGGSSAPPLDAAALLSNGMSAAALSAVLVQQSHRMPPDMLAHYTALHSQLVAAEAVKSEPPPLQQQLQQQQQLPQLPPGIDAGMVATLLTAAAAGQLPPGLDPGAVAALAAMLSGGAAQQPQLHPTSSAPSPTSLQGPTRDAMALFRQRLAEAHPESATASGSPRDQQQAARLSSGTGSAFRPAASRGNAEALLARLAGGDGGAANSLTNNSDAATQLRALMAAGQQQSQQQQQQQQSQAQQPPRFGSGQGFQPPASGFQQTSPASGFQPTSTAFQAASSTAFQSASSALTLAPAHFPRVERPAVSRSGSLGLPGSGGFGMPVTSGGSLWDSGAGGGSSGRR